VHMAAAVALPLHTVCVDTCFMTLLSIKLWCAVYTGHYESCVGDGIAYMEASSSDYCS
jgi:hypothetical protein